MKRKDWSIFCATLGSNTGKFEIAEGVNDQGDGPERTIGVFYNRDDANEICKLHNDAIGWDSTRNCYKDEQ